MGGENVAGGEKSGELRDKMAGAFAELGFDVVTDKGEIVEALNRGEYVPYYYRQGYEYTERDIRDEFLARYEGDGRELRLVVMPKGTSETGSEFLNFEWGAVQADAKGKLYDGRTGEEFKDEKYSGAGVNHDTNVGEMGDLLAGMMEVVNTGRYDVRAWGGTEALENKKELSEKIVKALRGETVGGGGGAEWGGLVEG